MEYKTIHGAVLEVGAIPRTEIDKFTVGHPEPEPPTRMVKTFLSKDGDLDEEVPVLDDTNYLAELAEYCYRNRYERIDLVASAIEIIESGDDETTAEDLYYLRLSSGDEKSDKASLLQHVILANESDRDAVVNLVFYNSTVTQRGIDEATVALGVTWMDQSVLAWHVPGTAGKHTALHEAVNVAKEYHYKWKEFCDLTGPEQSFLVAHNRLESRLQWLMVKK